MAGHIWPAGLELDMCIKMVILAEISLSKVHQAAPQVPQLAGIVIISACTKQNYTNKSVTHN